LRSAVTGARVGANEKTAEIFGGCMHDIVREYYGRELQSSADLKTSACCDPLGVPDWLKPALARIHPDVLERYYGCGFVCPDLLEGLKVLDLGCGAGRDVYALSQLVGPDGLVVGVDMTAEQLAIAEQYRTHHAEAFGFDNVRFLDGYIERLDALDLEPESFDVIVSNCVVNLSIDKGAVLRGVHRLLKEGGEFYFADIYADRRVPAALRDDPVLYGECLGGALYWNDFLTVAKASGFADPRLVEDRPIEVDPALGRLVGGIAFHAATYRLFKIAGLEPACEDHGQTARYRGSVAGNSGPFRLDKHHLFEAGGTMPVCGNTARMLSETRFAPHFELAGDDSRHFGIFKGCGTAIPFDEAGPSRGSAACC
jgi:arsenite methyltransferase